MKQLPLLVALALSASLIPPVQAQTTAPYVVQVCWSSPACVVTTVMIGGITYWQITQNNQVSHIPYDGEYLENPEGSSEEWEDDVFANEETAAAQCRLLAQQYGAIYVRSYRLNRAKFRCVFRTYRS